MIFYYVKEALMLFPEKNLFKKSKQDSRRISAEGFIKYEAD